MAGTFNLQRRRSGKYLYKPIMNETCCPQYTIRLDCTEFSISKGQSKVLKKMKRFLERGGDVRLSKRNNQSDTADIPTDLISPPVPITTTELDAMELDNIARPSNNRMLINRDVPLLNLISTVESTKETNSHNIKVVLDRAVVSHDSYLLYKKYQMFVHNDLEETLNIEDYKSFLVDTPLLLEQNNPHYGTFHQNYYIDEKLIAVGVIDILPNCVSAVYFYYDPEYGKLSLGTYSALREIGTTMQICEQHPDIKFYYMGYYINNCEKMKYKGNFRPSQLLCPVNYCWVKLSKVINLFNEEEGATALTDSSKLPLKQAVSLKSIQLPSVTPQEQGNVKIFSNRKIISSSVMILITQSLQNRPDFTNEICKLISLTGIKVMYNLALMEPND